MSKTIIESMYAITEKMKDPKNQCSIIVTPTSCKKAEPDLRYLRNTLGMTTMQVLILTAIIQKSARYRIDGDDIASFLGMEYLKFLTHDSDLEYLKKKGYIRMDKELHINVPKEVMRALKGNKPVEPEPTTGLTTGKILTRMKKLLAIRDDDEMDSDELDEEVLALFDENPDTSIAKTFKKYMEDLSKLFFTENIFLYVLICRYWFDDDDMVGWHNVDDYLDEDDLDDLRTDSKTERLYLQRKKIIEFTGYDGMLTKDYFKIKDEIKEEIFADVGGMRKEAPKVSASRKLDAASIGAKELFYNMDEGRQVAQLKELMSEKRFGEIRTKMKAKGLRTGFTCLFYGSPGTGKTETVYQIARECGRDLYIVDVSQVKSCWVGESEKNIKDVFDKYRQAVRGDGPVPILLFNEADSIIGTRREGAEAAVDKLENSLLSIILQEMENLEGIMIATTNLEKNMDKAFERRFLVKIRFNQPGTSVRKKIFETMIPELSDCDYATLANKYELSGGQIENVARRYTINNILHGECDNRMKLITAYCESEKIIRSTHKIGF